MKKGPLRWGWLWIGGFGAFLAALVLIGLPPRPVTAQRPEEPATGQEIASYRGYEEGGSGVPTGWIQDKKQTGKKGSVSIDHSRVHSGSAAVKLEPNKRNGGTFPLAIAQIIPAGNYRGRRAEFSGFIYTTGGAGPSLGMLNFVGGRPSDLVVTPTESAGTDWVRVSGVYDIPDDPSVQLVLTCIANGQSGVAWFDDVSVKLYEDNPRSRPGGPSSGNATPTTNARPVSVSGNVQHAAVSVDAGSVVRQIPRTLYGTNVEWIWYGNMLVDEASHRLNPDLVQLTRDMGVTLIRFPGGHFSDFYHWKDAVGPYERRREVLHEPGKNDKSRPLFGTDEALEFARLVNGELLITVNAGTGTAQEAADWVRYVNGKGQRVRYWEIGNELYTKDASPISKASAIDPATYAGRVIEFARAMRAVDPQIRIGAIGGENYGKYVTITYRDWDKTVLERAGHEIDFLAIHNAYAPVVLQKDENRDLRTVYAAMLAAPQLIAQNLDTVSKQIEQYAPSRANRISIAVTEWGPAFQFDPRSRYVDHVKTLGSALFAASTLKAFIESPRTDIANFFLLNDLSVLGWIGSSSSDFPPKPHWTPTARYYAFQLFTRHFGDKLVRTRTEAPSYGSPEVGFVAAAQNVPYLDVVSSLSADGRQLYVLAINKHFDDSIEADIDISGFRPSGAGTAWTLDGTAIDANTGTVPLKVPGANWARQAQDSRSSRFSSGGPGEVGLSSSAVPGVSGRFRYRFPPHSVTSLVLRAGNQRP